MKDNTSLPNIVSRNLRVIVGEYAPVLVLLVAIVVFSFIAPNFLTFNNFKLMIRQISFVTISAVGLMFVMVSGGIDLSVGSQIIFTNIVLSLLMSSTYGLSMDPLIAIPICLALGTILGTANGFLSNILKIHPLIITLGTAYIFRGLGYIAAGGRNIDGLPDSFRVYGQGYAGPIPVPIIIMLVVVIIGAYFLHSTYFGSRVYAMGGNQEAARLSGINIKRMRLTVFAIGGFASGITSVIMLSRVFNGQVSTGSGIEFDALTAALLGGVAFAGGEGTILGLVTGVLIIGVLNNGMQLFGLHDYYQNLVKGALLLAAVGYGEYQKSRRAKETIDIVKAENSQANSRYVTVFNESETGESNVSQKRRFNPNTHYAIQETPPAADTSHIRRRYLDLPYADLSPAQKLDIYLPDEGQGPFPVIVSIHGGAFMAGDKADVQLTPMLVGLKRGYAVVAVNYRLSWEAIFPAPVHDVKAAVRWIRAHAQRYHLAPDRIAAWGGSAGANLAAMLGTSAGVPELENLSLGHPEHPSHVQAVVAWFGPTDFLKMDEYLAQRGLSPEPGMEHSGANSPESLLLGQKITEIPEQVKAANPETYITPAAPPFFLQHGTMDAIVPVQMSIAFAAKLEQALGKERVQLELLEGAEHADPRFETLQNVEKVLDFFDTYMK